MTTEYFLPFKDLEVILGAKSYNLDTPKGLNQALLNWWYERILQDGCPANLALAVINKAIDDLPYNEVEPQYINFPKALSKWYPLSQEMVNEYNRILAHPLAQAVGWIQGWSYKLFYSWRKYFDFHCRYTKEKYGNKELRTWRGWWTIGENYSYPGAKLNLALRSPSHHLCANLAFGGEGPEQISFSLGLGLISIHLAAKILPLKWFTKLEEFFKMEYLESYDLGISLVEEYIFLNLFSPDNAGGERHYSLDWKKLLLGKLDYTSQDIARFPVEVKLPEKVYSGIAKIYKSKWTRSRFNWVQELLRCEIEVSEGIPIPGKGENSWDLEDTHSYGSNTILGTNVEDCIQKFVEYILDRRLKYGGSEWQPSK